MKKTLTTSQKIYCQTEQEADETFAELKEKFGDKLKKYSRAKREKSTKEEFIEYYVVTYTIEYSTLKELGL